MPLMVLVVDDEPAVRRLLVEVLRDEGYQTLAAEDGARALEMAAKRRPDIVLSDVMMPRLDGLALAARFARWDPPVPVILMSAVYATRLPGVPFVAKPFDLDTVLSVLAAMVDAA